MNKAIPEFPKIYYIVHVNNLSSIIEDKCLLSDVEIRKRKSNITSIGMNKIKNRRLKRKLESHTDLCVGYCVPFYFCPRSIMLYILYKGNHEEIIYSGGQEPIIHLQADLKTCINWADKNQRRWAFTLSNAGSLYFHDKSDLSKLGDINWNAVQANEWSNCVEKKQAEFLIEKDFPWQLTEMIGVYSKTVAEKVKKILKKANYHIPIKIKKEWYY